MFFILESHFDLIISQRLVHKWEYVVVRSIIQWKLKGSENLSFIHASKTNAYTNLVVLFIEIILTIQSTYLFLDEAASMNFLVFAIIYSSISNLTLLRVCLAPLCACDAFVRTHNGVVWKYAFLLRSSELLQWHVARKKKLQHGRESDKTRERDNNININNIIKILIIKK